MLYEMFRKPYLNVDTGANEGGGTTTETQTETNTATENQTTGTEQQTATEQPKFKIKYNHQEMELPYEEAVQHIQKGMNYDKAVERARQEAAQAARDAWIAEQGYVWNDKPITTEAEYKQALREKEIEDKLRAQYSNLPDEVVNEIIEGKKFREETIAERKAREEHEAKARQEYELSERRKNESLEFLKYFRQENGREFDVENDKLPQEVIDMSNKGKTLADAYAYYINNQLKTKLQAYEKNTTNAASTTGSLTGNGANGADFISYETFEANKSNPEWVKKNYSKIMESRPQWNG